MVSLKASTGTVATWRDRVATGLMLLAAIGAFISFVTSITSLATAHPATQVVEIWRMYGFFVFSGIYVLLAFWPRKYPGIWELAILDKAALGITGFVLLGRGVADAQTILIFDGSLAVITCVAYLLTRGYTGWSRLRETK
ncbi:hypothetical protein [Ktedonospora formicarum]|uniref:Uncharacterized protein n=1 Tax=Ktedonospora formicarum TaxID=2778364 RepID=A0A8J3I3H7_9CHLR|nr:hypothetical protein [Ktedonospora formicarum]GHO48096.1 hypothetical protein KSX_62590 [Ktedonospora formicarum]